MSLAFKRPALYLITKGASTPSDFDETSAEILRIIEIAVEVQVPLIQLREKNLPARMLLDLARRALHIARGSSTCILINDRADVALAAGADGVHLTATSLSPPTIRKNFPPDFIIGVSTHSLAKAKAAADGGADFAVFGPVFESPGKGEQQGVEKLKEVCRQVAPFPIFALGGIDESNLEDVMAAGAQGIAAIRFFNDPDRLRKLSTGARA